MSSNPSQRAPDRQKPPGRRASTDSTERIRQMLKELDTPLDAVPGAAPAAAPPRARIVQGKADKERQRKDLKRARNAAFKALGIKPTIKARRAATGFLAASAVGLAAFTNIVPGTGGPDPNTTFTLLDGSGTTVTRKASRGKGAIPDEHTAKIHNDEGTLSMANAGPESGGSQFFINVERNRRLDWFGPPDSSKHPVFGKVIEGYEVVKAITEVPTGRDGRDRPNEPIQMISITVEE